MLCEVSRQVSSPLNAKAVVRGWRPVWEGWRNVTDVGSPGGNARYGIPQQPSTGETELTVSQPLRRALLLSFSTSNTLSPGCFAETLYRSFRRRRWCTGGAAKGVSTLCKRSACDADVLESNERREILFSADHSAGRPYILVPYWSIAMHTGRGSYIAPTIFERVKWKAPCCGNV